MKKNDYLCIGKIINTRGINGELKVESWCDYPEKFYEIKKFFLDVNSDPLKITNLRVHKFNILMKIQDINDMSVAKDLCGKKLYAFKDDITIDKDSYFIEDLKGCEVFNFKTNHFYGTLKDIFNTGANDIYSIVDTSGKEYLLPIIKGTVCDIDLNNNKIFINPIKGVFDE